MLDIGVSSEGSSHSDVSYYTVHISVGKGIIG